MIVTSSMIWQELQEQKKLLKMLLEEKESFSIQEVSLNKTCKLLKLGSLTVIDLVKKGKLKARTYKDKNRKVRYRFRLADIKEFQESEQYETVNYYENANVESVEDIVKRIFG